MEDYFLNQTEIYEALKKLLSNIKKDGAERKTIDYCNRKSTMLETYWRDYVENHRKMCKFNTFDHVYFTKKCFETAEEVYMTIKQLLDDIIVKLSQSGKPAYQRQSDAYQRPAAAPEPHGAATPGPSAAPAPGPSPAPVSTPLMGSTSYHTNINRSSKLDEMIKKQSIHFKAFMRTVSTIDLDHMQNRWEFEDALKTLQNRWATIDHYHWEIEAEDGGNDVCYQNEFTRYESTFNDLKKTINTKMWSASHRDKSTPQMDIPVFNGNYHHWTSFKDLFDEAIHRNPSLSQAQNMQFLKNKVTGEAERLIHHLPISSDNYEVCWEILNHRFNNKRLIFTSHINTLLSIHNMQQQAAGSIKKLHDVCKETLYAIKNLGVDITSWDPILVHLLAQKLDGDSFAEYLESVKNPRELPVLQEFLEYLETKFTTLEASRRKQDPLNLKVAIQNQPDTYQKRYSNNNNQNNYNSTYNKTYNSKPNMKSMPVTRAINCVVCNSAHGLWSCNAFLQMNNEQKLDVLNKHNLCNNCFVNHFNKPCQSTKTCRKCSGAHNTLMHEPITTTRPTSSMKPAYKPSTRDNKNSSINVSWNDMSEILLATAMIDLTGKDGIKHRMRALVDQGSQVSLISEKAAQTLGLKRSQCKGKIFGVGEKENNCKGMLNVVIQSIHSSYTTSVNVIIMNNLIKSLPTSTFSKPSWPHIQDIKLADPSFFVSQPVDLLLGADVYSKIMLGSILRGENEDQPIAQQTKLGWLLCGSLQTFQCNVVLHEIDDLKRFWEIEDIANSEIEMSSEDHECMEYFRTTTKRREDGRFEVRIPFKSELKEKLGDTKPAATAQFRNLEGKLAKNVPLKNEYQKCMKEYIDLNHMIPAKMTNTHENYLPHHAVIRAEATTSKVRVVFNASQKSSSGLSLNDVMHKGPNLQQDLQHLIMKWRQYQYAYTADIEKMYRQIMIHSEDQSYQKILWRDSDNQPLRIYQLTTLTFGFKVAPYIAMQCLKRLAEEEKEQYPDAARALDQDFYMDDYCGGSHTIPKANQLRRDLVELLAKSGFNLRKWTANDPRILENSQTTTNQEEETFEFKVQADSTKTLGLGWKPTIDKFYFKSTIEMTTKPPTKRSLLSDISKLFDPLGWLTPISINMKILFQTVWLSALDWSDTLPEDIATKWTSLRQDIQLINIIEVNRWLGTTKNNQKVELHGFSDASNKAYSAVIYCKVTTDNQTTITLAAAKARLAPLNKTCSTPRLELMGAKLLSELMEKVQSSLTNYALEKYCWVDSTAVLGWIQGEPGRWKPFVSNRVKAITEAIPSSCWRYVNTSENPADCASRGLTNQQLQVHGLWWQGPSWLPSYKKENTSETIIYDTTLEQKPIPLKQVNTVTCQNQSDDTINTIINRLLERYSDINKLTRIFAWILRIPSKTKGVHQPYLTLQELRRANLLTT
ncbi:hypothetical protein JYU34_007543 [Plutella xylostella]|uniref:Reverse transcriptase domain-containing protein n=1 Tax=Plutella xylostella TaxID=51655 RepID=A0ABQ7QQN6_PLUXY|nr:hypothetical protein JYU34_007543 [Plutella xylostella]